MNIHITHDGQQKGPYSLDELNTAIAQGSVPAHALAWYEGCAEWISLSGVEGIDRTHLSSCPPPPPPPPPQAYTQPDATGGIIPYKNPKALIAYYLGICALLPFFGFFIAILSISFGVSGIKHYKRYPLTKGVVHAWIGIILSCFSIAVHCTLLIFFISSIMAEI